jgi:hypothetical protein
MNAEITGDGVVSRLRENRLDYAELQVGARHRIVVSRRGGHILGPFEDAGGTSALWLNPKLASASAFAEFLRAGEWNLGGERIWIAPEIQFNIKDRRDFWGSYELPAAMDPGSWAISAGPRSVELSQDLELGCHNTASGSKRLTVRRVLRAAENPLRSLSAFEVLMSGVVFAGWHHLALLSEVLGDGIMAESWNLAQVRPGGEAIIPCTPGLEYLDYYEPIDGSHLSVERGAARLKITGDRRYKVGFRTPNLLGRIGYLRQVGAEASELIVRNFHNDPSSSYVEEPADAIGCRGLSLNVYNDGGALGGFGELECNGRTIGGETGRSASSDEIALWYFRGTTGAIAAIAGILLGS